MGILAVFLPHEQILCLGSSGFVYVLPQINMSKSVCLWRERVRLFVRQVRVQSHLLFSHTAL